MRDPFSAANREMGLPIYSATPAQTKNPIFKDLIKTQVLVLAENRRGVEALLPRARLLRVVLELVGCLGHLQVGP